jgi:hypothetical protein
MNIRPAIAIAFAIVSGIGASHARAAGAVDKIVLTCPMDRMPTMQDIAALISTTTFQSTYNARDRVLRLVRQACDRGAVVVNVVAGPEPANSVVQRDALDIARGLPVQ